MDSIKFYHGVNKFICVVFKFIGTGFCFFGKNFKSFFKVFFLFLKFTIYTIAWIVSVIPLTIINLLFGEYGQLTWKQKLNPYTYGLMQKMSPENWSKTRDISFAVMDIIAICFLTVMGYVLVVIFPLTFLLWFYIDGFNKSRKQQIDLNK